jgi:predicted ABC-type ATPase
MLELIDQHVAHGESFAFETTLAGKTFVHAIPRWRDCGYLVVIYFLALPSVKQALDRVARRVRQGGHAVDDEVVRRRFDAGWRNFKRYYVNLADRWVLLDNSGPEPILIDSGGRP